MLINGTDERGVFIGCMDSGETQACVQLPNEHTRIESRTINVSDVGRAPLPVIDPPNATVEETAMMTPPIANNR